MRYISNEELEHMRDPIAKMVWEQWLKEGKAELVEEIQKCDTTCANADINRGGVY
jgi:hypothetical protein